MWADDDPDLRQTILDTLLSPPQESVAPECVQFVQVREKKLVSRILTTTCTGFSTNLLIKNDYAHLRYRSIEVRSCGRTKRNARLKAISRKKNGKGCDFGYALADNSCERVFGVDACTVTALWCDHRFHGSKPRLTPRSAVGFFGSGRSLSRLTERITQSTSEPAT